MDPGFSLWKITFLTPYTKNSQNLEKRQNVRPENIKLLEGNIGWTLFDVAIFFLDLFPKAKEIKTKITNET